MAYGYRDEDYLFLKIRPAFPGIPGYLFFYPWAFSGYGNTILELPLR